MKSSSLGSPKKVNQKPVNQKPLWFRGVCDSLEAKVKYWYRNYENGVVRRTRKAIDPFGIPVDVPVQFLHVVPLTEKEAYYFKKIMETFEPDSSLTEVIGNACTNVNKMTYRKPGVYDCQISLFKHEVKHILEIFEKAKDPSKGTLKEFVKEKKGSGIWKV